MVITTFFTSMVISYPNITSAADAVKHAIDVLDADVSELDPESLVLIAVSIPILLVVIICFCLWVNECRCCCFCCFGRRLVPNTDSKDSDIIGDEEFDPEAVHTDPALKKSDVSKPMIKKNDTDDDVTPTSPPATESSGEEEEEEEGNGGGGGQQNGVRANRSETPYEKDSRACCGAVADCLERELE